MLIWFKQCSALQVYLLYLDAHLELGMSTHQADSLLGKVFCFLISSQLNLNY